MSPLILAIESSCDDMAMALMKGGKVLSESVANQAIHAQYGGVIPELASRAHLQQLLPILDEILRQAGCSRQAIEVVAFTQGPGLLGPLLVGNSFAKGLAYALGARLVAVHHMHAHVWANFIEIPHPTFPFVCLTVSGGHTQLVLVKSPNQLEILGQTQDDAMGEAFDKIAKLMGFPYPGGPIIDQLAQQGDATRFAFPITRMPELDFSFSGIKTAFSQFLRKHQKIDANFVAANQHDICASIQRTLIEMALVKLRGAVQLTGVKCVALAGGVASNQGLRQSLHALAQVEQWTVCIPAARHCTDNAAMVAMAADIMIQRGQFCNWNTESKPRFPL